MLLEIFILLVFLVLVLLFAWSFRNLPKEEWQVLGCVPYRRTNEGDWQGFNLTWYGFFNALAVCVAVGVFLILTGAAGQSLVAGIILAGTMVALCLPAASLTARLVEGKKNTLSVGGASFVGILIGPGVIGIAGYFMESFASVNLPVMPLLAALLVAYAFGEGMGRLACVSFGCCYGKPLADCSLFLQRLFARRSFVFTGKTKKIAYAHQLDGCEVIPVQALTAVILTLSGLTGFYLFLQGFFASAFLLTLSVSQLWRVLSEFLRADYRGNKSVSAYQWMAAIAVFYGWFLAWYFGSKTSAHPNLTAGLIGLWDPAVILFGALLFTVTFIYTGKSSVTTCRIHIEVVKEKI
jgi:hypothetical protein